MNALELLYTIGDIDDCFIAEANKPRKTVLPKIYRWSACAACLCLIIGLAYFFSAKPPSGEIVTDRPDPSSLCDGNFLGKTSFTINGTQYSPAGLSAMEAIGLVNGEGDYIIAPENNIGSFIGLSINADAPEMEGLQVFSVSSIGSNSNEICIAAFPGEKQIIYEYFIKTEQH